MTFTFPLPLRVHLSFANVLTRVATSSPRPTDACRANGTSKRAMEDILNQASQGRLVTKAIPKTVRAGSTAAAHGVAAPKVGRRASSIPVMPGSFSGRKTHEAIKRENPGREWYDGTGIAPGRDNESAKDELAAQMEYRGMNAQQRMAAREEHARRVAGQRRNEGAGGVYISLHAASPRSSSLCTAFLCAPLRSVRDVFTYYVYVHACIKSPS